MNNIPFALFDDHSLNAHALKRLLLQLPSLKFLFKASCANALLQSLNSQFPQLLFVSYPFVSINSEDVIEKVRKKCREIKIIVLTNIVDSATILNLIDSGANCVLPTYIRPPELLLGINETMDKEYFFNELFSRAMFGELEKRQFFQKSVQAQYELKEDEIELVNDLYEELTHKEIADKRHVLPATIDTYTSRLIHKVGCKNCIGLIKYGLKNKLITVVNG